MRAIVSVGAVVLALSAVCVVAEKAEPNAAPVAPRPAVAPAQNMSAFGAVASVDAAAKTLTLVKKIYKNQMPSGEENLTFKLAETARIERFSSEAKSEILKLTDLTPGTGVTVIYKTEDAGMVASSVRVYPAYPPKSAAK